MTLDTIPQVGVPLPEISQLAFVVEDLEEGMRRFGSLFGVEPWLLYRYEPPRLASTTYRGEPHDYSMRVAMTDVEGPIDLTTDVVSGGVLRRLAAWLTSLRDRLAGGLSRPAATDNDGTASSTLPTPAPPGLNLELIEPLQGPSLYTEHLDEQGGGLHHLGCLAYDDPHAAVEMYEEAGVPVIQSGAFESLEFWYLDTRRELDGLIFEIVANPWAIEEPDGVFPP